MSDEKIAKIKKRVEEISEPWGPFSGNYPFYVVVKKPAPSLSKHEGTPRGAHMWRYQDGEFVAAAPYDIKFLLSELAAQNQVLQQYKETVDQWNKTWDNFTPKNAAKNVKIFKLEDALKALIEKVDSSLALDEDLGMAWDDLFKAIAEARKALE